MNPPLVQRRRQLIRWGLHPGTTVEYRAREQSDRSRTVSIECRRPGSACRPWITLHVYDHVISDKLAEATDIFARVIVSAG